MELIEEAFQIRKCHVIKSRLSTANWRRAVIEGASGRGLLEFLAVIASVI